MKSNDTVRKPVFGLLGGIGSGKSEVARLLAAAGGRVISGDALGHEALRDPAIVDEVVKRWGRDVLDEQGAVNRRAVGKIVFADANELRALEALVHPWIKRRIPEEIQAAQEDPAAAFIVLDAAVMLEAGWHDVCGELMFVDVPRAVRLERIARQRGWTEKEVTARENAQWPLTEKRRMAQIVLDNSGTSENLRDQVLALVRERGLPQPST